MTLGEFLRSQLRSKMRDRAGAMEPTQLILPAETLDKLREWAGESDISVAHLIRLILEVCKPFFLLEIMRCVPEVHVLAEGIPDAYREFVGVLRSQLLAAAHATGWRASVRYQAFSPRGYIWAIETAAPHYDATSNRLISALLIVVVRLVRMRDSAEC